MPRRHDVVPPWQLNTKQTASARGALAKARIRSAPTVVHTPDNVLGRLQTIEDHFEANRREIMSILGRLVSLEEKAFNAIPKDTKQAMSDLSQKVQLELSFMKALLPSGRVFHEEAKAEARVPPGSPKVYQRVP